MLPPLQRAAALGVGILAFVAGVTCSDGATGPTKGLRALVGIAPVFSQAAEDVYRNLVSLEVPVNNVRVRLLRGNDAVAVDTTVTVAAGQDSVVLQIPVDVDGAQEVFEATIQLRNGEQVLFSGTQTVTARIGAGGSPASQPVVLEYIGPGSQVTTLDVDPDTTISGQNDIQMRVVGRDANNAVVPNLSSVLGWSVSSAAVGSISQAGVFHPIAGGSTVVTAELPTGVSASATVVVAPPPSAVVLISGGNQTGTVGTALGAPIVVEVRTAAGGPVPGHAVTFAVIGGGGSIAPTSVTTGSNGRASATLTLGTVAGENTVQVTAAGLTPFPVTATGNAGAATQLVIAQQPSATTASGELLGTQPSARLRDAFGNNVSTANVAVTADLNPAGSFTLQGTATRNTNSSGVVAFTDLRITGPEGTTALRFSATGGGLTSVTSQTITVAPVGPVIAWTNPAGGNWNTASNWSTGTVPTNTSDVAITLAGTYTVTLDANVTVATLTLGGSTGTQTLSGTGRTLGITGSGTVNANGVLALSGSSSLAASGPVTNQGTIALTGSTMGASTSLTNHGTLILGGTTLINGPIVAPATSVVRVEGSSAGGNAAITISNGFVNNGLIEFTSVDGGFATLVTVSSGTLTNDEPGTIRSAPGAGGARTLIAQLTNHGTLDVDHPLLLSRADADHLNTGPIDLSNGDLTVSGTGATPSFTNTGVVTLGANRFVNFQGGAVTLAGGSVTGPTTSRFIASGVTLDFTTPDVSVPMTTLTTTVVGGSVTVAGGQTLSLLNGAWSAALDVEAGGALVTRGTITLNGALSVQAGGLVQAVGDPVGGTATLTVTTGFINSGRIELTSVAGGFTSILTVTNGTLTNAPGATFNSAAGAGGARTLAAQLDNQGTLDVDQPLILQDLDGDHANSGTIDLTAANLNVNLVGATPSFTNTGSIVLGASRTWTIGGGQVSLATGSVTGQPTSVLAVTGSVLAFTTATVTVPMTLVTTSIAGGSVNVFSDESLTLVNGGLSDPIAVENGAALIIHGAVSLTGALTTEGIVRVEGDPTAGTAHLIVADGFVNQGQIQLTSVAGGFASQLTVTNGSLSNAPGAAIRSMPGAGGVRTLAAQLVNQGLLVVDQPLTLDKASAQHSNAGTIDLTNANLTVNQSGSGPEFVSTGTVTLGADRTWTVTGGSLSLSGGSVSGPVTATLVVNGATFSFSPDGVSVPLTLNGTSLVGGILTIGFEQDVTLRGGGLNDPVTVESGGLLVTHGAVALNGALNVQTSAMVRVEGDNTGGTAHLTILQGFTSNGTIQLTSTAGGFTSQITVQNNFLTNGNAGTIHSMPGAGGARILDAQLENVGLLDVDQPLTLSRTSGLQENRGNIDLTNADLTVSLTGTAPGFGNTGNIALGAGRTLTVNGGGGGTFDTSEGIVTGTPTSRLVVSNAEFSFFAGNTNVPLTLNNVTLGGSSLDIGDSQIVTLLHGGLNSAVNVNSGGTLVIHGTVNLGGAVQTLGGTIRIEGDVTGGNAHLVVNNGFVNNGTIDLTSVDGGFASQLTVNNGTLNNNGDAGLLSSPGAGGARIITAQLENNGDMVLNHPLTLNRLDAQHLNNSSIILSANLSVIMNAAGGFTSTPNSNVTLIGANRLWSLTGGTVDIDEGTVTTSETTASLSVNSATSLSFTPNTVSIPLQIVNTPIFGGITVGTSQTVTLLNSNLPASTAINVLGGGTLVIRGGTTFNGPLTQGGNLRIEGASFGAGAVLTVANGFTNNGFIDLTSIDGGFGAQLIVSSGTITNAGDIASTPGAGGSRTLTAQLDNTSDGGLDVHTPLVINAAGANHTNGGTFDISSNVTITGSASLTNTGTLGVSGSQTFTVGSGTVTNGTGGLIVGSGTLNVSGATFVNNGAISPASNGTGTFTITGNYTQGTGSVNINMSGTNCSQFDVLAISGTAVLTGTTLNIIPSCVSSPLNGQQFTILTTGGRTGTFTPNIPILPGGVLLQPLYGASDLVLNTLIP